MKIILGILGVLIGIYLAAEHPDLAQLIWNTAMDWLGRAIDFINDIAERKQ